jgi:cyclase
LTKCLSVLELRLSQHPVATFPKLTTFPRMQTRTLVPLTFALLATAALAQRDLSNVQIKTTQVAKNVYMLEGSGGNIGVSVGPDGILIVDDQFAPLSEKIEAAVKQLNPGKLKFVLNTHFHGDHTGGNANFAAKDATIIAQSNVRTRLAADTNSTKAALPVITFDQSASVHFNGEEIKLLHHGPGHTDGDSIILFTGANVVHMGDQFVNGMFPFIDANSGGSLDGYLKTVTAVLEKMPADAKIIPGHGPLGTVDDLKKFRDMIAQTSALVRNAITDGKTLEQIKAAGFLDQWKSWGGGFINTDRWIETIYNDATARKN